MSSSLQATDLRASRIIAVIAVLVTTAALAVAVVAIVLRLRPASHALTMEQQTSSFTVQMGMPGRSLSTSKVEAVRFEAHGELFSMTGRWRLDMQLQGPNGQETASFDVVVG